MSGAAAKEQGRIAKRFAALRADGRRALGVFIMAGDPNLDRCFEVMRGLPAAGADMIELGMPFTDPMADGPAIQRAGQRALAAGMTLEKTLELVRRFRETDPNTPVILMGYYNPIYSRGVTSFLDEAVSAGADGLIVVDLPPEEDDELCVPARNAGLDFIRLATPTTDDKRLPTVLKNTGGFVYYVSITGVTGAREADAERVRPEIARLKAHTQLPVCVGFGVKNADIAEAVASVSDGVIVGSAVVERLGDNVPVADVLGFVESLSKGVRRAR